VNGVAIDTLTVSKLTKRYGFHRALAGVDLTFSAGKLCALLGPNGAGKSTLLGILSTLVRPSRGSIKYGTNGSSIEAGSELRAQIGVLAHSALIYGELTAVENLEFFGRLYALGDVRERASKLLDEVGLNETARNRAAGTYSRGMTQRLSLARALLHDPQILLLDEPFTGLDRQGAAALAKTLATARASKRIILVVTHDLESLAGVTDHVVVLRRGKVAHEQMSDAEDGFGYEELKEIYHQYTE